MCITEYKIILTFDTGRGEKSDKSDMPELEEVKDGPSPLIDPDDLNKLNSYDHGSKLELQDLKLYVEMLTIESLLVFKIQSILSTGSLVVFLYLRLKLPGLLI